MENQPSQNANGPDSSMEEPNLNPNSELPVLPAIVSGDIQNVLARLVNINDSNILHEPTCMICSSPQREDLEKKWLETKNHKDVKELFKSKSDLRISDDVIDNHMRFHYERGIKELQKIEYVEKIRRLSNIDLTTLDRIKLGLDAITERMMGINSITPSNDTSAIEVEQIKSSETSRLMATYNQLLKLKAGIMGEMKNNGELIILPRQEFIDIFNKSIVNAKNDAERNIIKNILSDLSDLGRKTQ